MTTGLFAECWNCGARTLLHVADREIKVGDTLRVEEQDAVQDAAGWPCTGCGRPLKGSTVVPDEYPVD